MPTVFHKLLNAFLPERCPVCTDRSARGFCDRCRELLPWILSGCEVCGAALAETVSASGVCGACLTKPPAFNRAVIPFQYRAPVSDHIKTLKYNQRLRHADSLAAMVSRRVWLDSHAPPDVIIPVPLHPRRLRMRGFNQALEIARSIGNELGIKVDHTALARIRHTASQTGLGSRQRRGNVKGAFKAIAPIRGKHVALVDDVVTSGSTAHAAARALKAAGVETVSLWAAARS